MSKGVSLSAQLEGAATAVSENRFASAEDTSSFSSTFRATHSQPVEAVSVPMTLFTPMFDSAPLKTVIDTLASKVASLESRTVDLDEDNQRLREEVEFCTHKYNIAQEQLTAVFQTVTSYNEDLCVLKAASLPRDEARPMFAAAKLESQSLREALADLDNKKIDTHSSLLETRIREVADDSCNRFLLRREREQKEWVTLQVTNIEAKVSSNLESTRNGMIEQMEAVKEAVSKRQEELANMVRKTDAEIHSKAVVQEAVDRSLVSKLDSMEKLATEVKGQLFTELDRVETNLKKSLKCLGLDFTSLMEAGGITNPYPIHVDDDVDTVTVQFHRDVNQMYHQKEVSAGWKFIRSANYQLLTHIPRLCRAPGSEGSGGGASDVEPLDVEGAKRRLELAKEERLKAVRRLREQHRAAAAVEHINTSLRGGPTFTHSSGGGGGGHPPSSSLTSSSSSSAAATTGTTALHPVTRYILQAPVFSEQQRLTSEHLLSTLSDTKKDLSEDFGVQIQRIQRIMKEKVTTQRAVDLIEEFAVKAVASEVDKVASGIHDLASTIIPRDEVISRLETKAEKSMLSDRATTDQLEATENSVRDSILEMRENVLTRITATLEGKLKDMDDIKLGKADPMLRDLMTTVDQIVNGSHPALSFVASSQGGTGGSGGTPRCLTCNRTSDTVSVGGGGGTTNISPETQAVSPGPAARPRTAGAAASSSTRSNILQPSNPQLAPQGRRVPKETLDDMRDNELQAMQELHHAKQMSGTVTPPTGGTGGATGGSGSRPGSARSGSSGDVNSSRISRQSSGGRPLLASSSNSRGHQQPATLTQAAQSQQQHRLQHPQHQSTFSLEDWANRVDAKHNHGQHAATRQATSTTSGRVSSHVRPQVLESGRGERIAAEQMLITQVVPPSTNAQKAVSAKGMKGPPIPPHPPH